MSPLSSYRRRPGEGPGSADYELRRRGKGSAMYIGGGALLVIIIIVVILLLRR